MIVRKHRTSESHTAWWYVLLRDQTAISEIIGTILIIVLVVGVAAIIAAIFMGYGTVLVNVPVLSAEAYKNESAAFLFHQGGSPVNQDTLTILVNDQPVPSSMVTLVSGSWPWSPGELLEIAPVTDLRSLALVFNDGSNEVLLARFDTFGTTTGNLTPSPDTSWQDFFMGPGPSYNLTLHGVSVVPGHTGNGLFFDGSGYVSIPPSPDLAPPGGISIDAWVKWAITPSSGNRYANLVTKGESDSNMQYALQHDSNNDRFEFAVRTTQGRRFVQSAGGIQKDTWYHVVSSYSAATGKLSLSVNGGTPAVVNYVGTLVPGDYELHIGEGINNNRYFNGIIDDVKISVM